MFLSSIDISVFNTFIRKFFKNDVVLDSRLALASLQNMVSVLFVRSVRENVSVIVLIGREYAFIRNFITMEIKQRKGERPMIVLLQK